VGCSDVVIGDLGLKASALESYAAWRNRFCDTEYTEVREV